MLYMENIISMTGVTRLPCGLTLTMLSPDISCFENSVDPDQLASEKPADQDQHCFKLFT